MAAATEAMAATAAMAAADTEATAVATMADTVADTVTKVMAPSRKRVKTDTNPTRRNLVHFYSSSIGKGLNFQ